ncbi:hypothetical protein BDN71DRAFT_1456376 [Pleurotus eryngii]|uniref:Uncharacterized protein n=1 Tax=Pleurotus eryngii TaxID=5323 RepID=A0A9P5ZP23_PLEER|nr:hypothetical protein BDN71DRAFT_1456376 [Pleurotus eryngii]
MSKPKRATSADAFKRVQSPAVPRVGAKPAVRRPKQRLTRRQYHRYVFFNSSGDEEVSAGSSTEDEGEHKTGLVEYDTDDSDNEADTYERELNEHEDESDEEGDYAYTHPISYIAYGSASEDSEDSDDTPSSSSSSHLAQPAPLPVELISVSRSLEPISLGMYGSSSPDDSDDGSSSSSSSSSSLAKPVNASQDATGMDADTDDEPLDPVYAATSGFYMPCSAYSARRLLLFLSLHLIHCDIGSQASSFVYALCMLCMPCLSPLYVFFSLSHVSLYFRH